MAPRKRVSRRLVVLGPQHGAATLATAIDDLVADGDIPDGKVVATVTAGWQDREGDLDALEAGTRELRDLGLYERANRVADRDPELAAAHETTQRRLKELRRAYNLRLRGGMATWSALWRMAGDEEVLGPEREDALASIRALDLRHLGRVAEVRAEYEESFTPLERESVAIERAEIDDILAGAGALVVAGGHVATLLNRLRMFGIAESTASLPVIAWSAGAMALAARVVLFHDRPPWGPGHAEAFENGLGVIEGLVPFPHASRRLELDDRPRMARLARRFQPAECVLLDPGARLDRRKGKWSANEDTLVLDARGGRAALGSRAA